jgi:hypothetical protein
MLAHSQAAPPPPVQARCSQQARPAVHGCPTHAAAGYGQLLLLPLPPLLPPLLLLPSWALVRACIG